ncbi:4Fe-4S dicluster domain-containing protein [candidate division KSB1 bacterium]|nr:MAG: 4Fe-4S dicluster domain-containing protein [candidate division KSB1 bacterium]
MKLVKTKSASGDYTVEINETWCKGCRICVDLCPNNVLVMVEVPDRWEGSIARVADIEACNGCGICEVECPDFAISVYAPEKKKAAKTEEAGQ